MNRRRLFYGLGVTAILAGTAVVVVVSRNTALTPEERALAAETQLDLSPETIASVEAGLIAEGFHSGDADGVLEVEARTGLREWQSANGLAATGYLDRASVAELLPSGRGRGTPGRDRAPRGGGSCPAGAASRGGGAGGGAAEGRGGGTAGRATARGGTTARRSPAAFRNRAARGGDPGGGAGAGGGTQPPGGRAPASRSGTPGGRAACGGGAPGRGAPRRGRATGGG